MARLVIYEELDTDDTVFETFELSSSRILIGSDHDNHLVLDMPDVDMTHASLELRDNHWFLQDLGGPAVPRLMARKLKARTCYATTI